MNDQPDFLDLPPIPAPETELLQKPAATFQGNGYDLAAMVGVTTGGLVLISCLSLGLGFYCLPLIPVVLGIIGLVKAREAVNPERTRLLSWLSLGAGGVILLLILLFVAIYVFVIIFAIAGEGNGF